MSKPIKIITIICFSFMLVFFSILLLEYIELVKSKQRISFATLVKNEQLSSSARKAIYLGLKADQCGFIKDKESLILSFALESKIDNVLEEINNLILNNYLAQEKEINLVCK